MGIEIRRTLNSFFVKAGFMNNNICQRIRGNEKTRPARSPELRASVKNWKGEVNAMLIPLKLRDERINDIIFS